MTVHLLASQWVLYDESPVLPPYGLESPVVAHLLSNWTSDQKKVRPVSIACDNTYMLFLAPHSCCGKIVFLLLCLLIQIQYFMTWVHTLAAEKLPEAFPMGLRLTELSPVVR
jgi:hypothetical protein